MEESKTLNTDSFNSQQEYVNNLIKIRREKYQEMIKKVFVFLGSISLAMMALLFICYFFWGIANFFNVVFSFPGRTQWINTLPDAKILHPEGELTKLIFMGLFFILYLTFGVIIIVKTILTIKSFIKLCDLNNKNLNHLSIILVIIDRCSSCYSLALTVTLLSFSSNSGITPCATLLIILYGVYFVGILALKGIFTTYEVETNTFNKKTFLLVTLRNLAFTVISTTLLFATLKPELFNFVNNIIDNYKRPTNYSGVNFYSKFFLPLIKWLLSILCTFTFAKFIKLDKTDYSVITSNFFGKNLKEEMYIASLQRIYDKRLTFTIVLTAIIIFLEILFYFFNTQGQFFISTSLLNNALKTIITYTPAILLSVALKKIFKIKLSLPLPIHYS